ncbi:hypothetical protein LINGRAPRIM_LOCUS2520, partial [Linum grandiflorum]
FPDSGSVAISHGQYQALYSLLHGHGYASGVLGPAPPTIGCVTTSAGPSLRRDSGKLLPLRRIVQQVLFLLRRTRLPQDRITSLMIGTTKLSGGLYRLSC